MKVTEEVFEQAVYEHEQLAMKLSLATSDLALEEREHNKRMGALRDKQTQADHALKNHRKTMLKFAREM